MLELLAPLRVLELPGEVATRYCGALFARLGAEVTRLDPGRDDDAIGHAGEAGRAYGRWLDHGKRRAGGDSEADGFDLVIAGQSQEAVADAEARLARSPGAALLALTWFAPIGPYAAWRGTDEMISALAGLAYGFGLPQGPPMLAQGHGPQIAAGLTAFNAAAGALLAPPVRRPRRIAVNVFEACLCFTETGAMASRVEGTRSSRLGVNRFVPTYPASSYRTADGWVGVTALTPAQWRSLTALIGRPELGAEPRFATAYERLMLADEVDAILAPVFLSRTTEAWVAAGDAHRIPTAPMPRPSELPGLGHWAARQAFAAFDETGVQGPTLPFRMTFDGVAEPLALAPGGGPLSGLRVADFSMGWAGPLCTRTLGDLGADVIKVESASHPDWWRGWEADAGGDPPPSETRQSFIAVNRNKRGVALDLTTADGLVRAKQLVASADVVVENFAAGVMRKLGLGMEAQRALRPGLISVSMPAFGNGGPLSGLRAYGSTVEQASGLPFLNGEPDWPPALQHVAYGDPLAGLYAAAAVLAALHGRARLGGADIDLAQVACLFQFAADGIIAEQLVGAPTPRIGVRRARAAPTTVVRVQGPDAWLVVSVPDEAAWRGLCTAMAADDWQDDPELADREGRLQRSEEIDGRLAAWAAGLAAPDAAARLQLLGVPAAPVQPTHSLTFDGQLAANGFWVEMERRYVGRHLIGAAPLSFDGRRPALIRPAPILGEHTLAIFPDAAIA